MLLIGSRALAFWNPDFHCKEDSDWDIITADNIPLGKQRVELHDSHSLNNKKILHAYSSDHYVKVNGVSVNVCTLKGLAVIKRSHLYRDHFFNKHMHYYNHFLKGNFTAFDKKMIKERFDLTKKMIKQPHPSLRKTNEEFFDDPITKKYVHDWLHTLTAYEDKPMYLKMKVRFASAWCERDMWETFSQKEKLQTVAEEVYVIACERFLIPQDWPNKHRRYYDEALKKVCTTLTSGWFRDFAIDNYPEISDMFDKNKFKEIEGKINDSL